MLSGSVFEDSNGNGTQEDGEGGVEGALVLLEQSQRMDAERRETQTDSLGVYRFWQVTPGSYQLGVILPDQSGAPHI